MSLIFWDNKKNKRAGVFLVLADMNVNWGVTGGFIYIEIRKRQNFERLEF